jgi:hypothetical protein
MAKYNVTHTCGHTETVQLYDSVKSREYRLSRLEQEQCQDCKRSRHDASNLEATIANAINGLPALMQGSDRQIGWADQIRRTKLLEMDALMAKLYADPRAQEEPSLMAAWQAAERAVRSQTSATWWIDHRNKPVADLMRDLVRS